MQLPYYPSICLLYNRVIIKKNNMLEGIVYFKSQRSVLWLYPVRIQRQLRLRTKLGTSAQLRRDQFDKILLGNLSRVTPASWYRKFPVSVYWAEDVLDFTYMLYLYQLHVECLYHPLAVYHVPQYLEFSFGAARHCGNILEDVIRN